MAKYDVEEEHGPLFTIITVTFNAADTIGATLDSVRSQSCTLFEHLIIDGASSDDTLKICHAGATPRERVFSSPDKGLYDAMNKGIALARGKYLIFLNAGDRFHSSDTLQRITDTILSNNYPGVVYGQTDIVDINGNRLADRHLTAPKRLTLGSFAEGMVVCHQSFVALRRITSRYNLKYRYSADYEWCIRVLQHSRLNVMMPEVLTDYLSEGLSTKNRTKSLIERFRIMCYYYGTIPTLWRHLKFIPRFLRRRKVEKKFKKPE